MRLRFCKASRNSRKARSQEQEAVRLEYKSFRGQETDQIKARRGGITRATMASRICFLVTFLPCL